MNPTALAVEYDPCALLASSADCAGVLFFQPRVLCSWLLALGGRPSVAEVSVPGTDRCQFYERGSAMRLRKAKL